MNFISPKNTIFVLVCWLLLQIVPVKAQNSAQKLLEQGQKARNEGRLPDALRYYLQALPDLKTEQKAYTNLNLRIAELYQTWGVHQKSIPFLHFVRQQTDSKILRDSAWQLLAVAHYENKSYDSTIYYLNEKINFQQQEKKPLKLGRSLQFLIRVYKESDQFREAISPSQNLIQLLRTQKDSASLSVALNNLGYLYKYLNQSADALKAFEEVFNIEQKLRSDAESRIVTLVNIGILHENQKEYAKSIAFLETAQKLALNNSVQLSKIQNLIARVHLATGNISEAEKLGLMAAQTARKAQLPEPLADACLTLSSVYRSDFNYQMALDYFEEHVDLQDSLQRQAVRQQKQKETQAGTAESLEKEIRLLLVDKEIKALQVEKFQLEAEKSAQEVALLKQESELEKATFEQQRLENKQKLSVLQLQKQEFEAEKQARQITDLQRDKEFQDLELREKEAREKERIKELELLNIQKKQLEQHKKIQDLQIQEEEVRFRYLVGIIGLGSLTFLLLFFFFIRNRKQNKLLKQQKQQIQETNQELHQQKEEVQAQASHLQQVYEEIRTKNDFLEEQKQTIENRNQKITDSINYANRIQGAMLPHASILSQFLPDSFIFFKPKDIVSGDFYWFTTFKNHVILAAMDCTGHGVPGAFMSMLGAQILQTLIHERELLDPASILKGIHEEIRTALSQDISKNRDGMDGSLVVVSPDKKQLRYAGARNPLVIIQNGEAQRIKGDKLSIGGESHQQKLFTTHLVEIMPEMSFFLFSDGFQDQSGGEQGRKFMSKYFRDFLAQIGGLPADEQLQKLTQTFEEWTKGYEQVDDVLVIGFQIK